MAKWADMNPRERAMLIRNHLDSVVENRISTETVRRLFGLSPAGLDRISRGEDWSPDCATVKPEDNSP